METHMLTSEHLPEVFPDNHCFTKISQARKLCSAPTDQHFNMYAQHQVKRSYNSSIIQQI